MKQFSKSILNFFATCTEACFKFWKKTYYKWKEVLIVGSGDIGLIMARRFTFEGAKVKGVVEIQGESRGLVRNIVQCIEDFDIPLYFRHKIAKIYGKDRVKGVEVVKVDENFNEIAGSKFQITCDTVLISVGLIPENELIEMAGVEMDKKTNTPVSTELNKTSIPGIFACGEVTSGRGTVIEAIAAGCKAALATNKYFNCIDTKSDVEAGEEEPVFISYDAACINKSSRIPLPPISSQELTGGFGFSEAGLEANRCFNCSCLAVNTSDIAVALLALGASLRIQGEAGTREVTVDEFFSLGKISSKKNNL